MDCGSGRRDFFIISDFDLFGPSDRVPVQPYQQSLWIPQKVSGSGGQLHCLVRRITLALDFILPFSSE